MSQAGIPRELDIRERQDGTTTVFVLAGSLDADTSQALTDRLHAALDAGVASVNLDLTGVRFVSSLGIGCLIAAFGDFQQAGRDLVLSGVSEDLRQMLRMLDLLDYIKSR